MYFSIETRPSIIKKNPTIAFGEVGKEIGAAWGKLSDAQKKPYQAQADKDKARYDREMAKYKPKK